MQNRYSHLLRGASLGLECVTCLEMEEVKVPFSLDLLVSISCDYFKSVGEEVSRVTYMFDGDSKYRRSSLTSFRRKFLGRNLTLGGVNHIAFSAAGHGDGGVSDTWTPKAYAALSRHGKLYNAIFFCGGDYFLNKDILFDVAKSFSLISDFSSAGIFQYPWVFSAYAYFNGVSYRPNIRGVGYPLAVDNDRITRWSTCCSVGPSPSDGYIRDIYSVNILSIVHMSRTVDDVSLSKWIESDPARGELCALNNKFLWSIESSMLRVVQDKLDDAGLTLSSI